MSLFLTTFWVKKFTRLFLSGILLFFKMQDISEEKRVTLERSEEGGLGISIQVSINHIIIIYYGILVLIL